MLVFLSFAYHTAREQQLLASPAIAEYLYAQAKACIAAHPELRLAGLLASHTPPFAPNLPVSLLAPSARLDAEVQAMQTWDSGRDWIVVLRPGVGCVSAHRLAVFFQALKQMDGPGLVLSLAPHNLLTNPCWNLKAAPRRFRVGDGVRLPRVDRLSKDDLSQACPELHQTIRIQDCQRSQDVPELFYDDQALYALRLDEAGALDTDNPDIREIPCALGPVEDLPLLYRTPLFSMNPDELPDCSSLERYCAAQLDHRARA